MTREIPIISCSWLGDADVSVLVGDVQGNLQKPELHYEDFVDILLQAGAMPSGPLPFDEQTFSTINIKEDVNMAMTSRERFLKVFNGEMPDRVPVTLFIVEQGHFINQVYPDLDPQDYLAGQLKVIELQKQFGCDVFVRLLYNVNDPLHIHMGGLDVSQTTDNWEPQTEVIKDHNVTIYRSTVRTPKGDLTQDFSISEIRPGTLVYACTKKPVHNEKDLDIVIEYEPRMPQWWPKQVKDRIRPVRRRSVTMASWALGRLTAPSTTRPC